MPRPLQHRLGIMQGRLVASATGELQCSPGALWPDEFAVAAALALNHIELMAEETFDAANPIWSSAGRGRINAVADATGVRAASLCFNETLTTAVDDAVRMGALTARLDEAVHELQPEIVVLPLFDESDLAVVDWSRAASSVDALGRRLHDRGVRLALELGVSALESLRFLDTIGNEHVGLCYDIGNATALGYDAAKELDALSDRVVHVHAKDKDAASHNVRFGTGAVDFRAAFAALSDTGFDGLVTMEATRGEDPAVTASEHRAFLLALEQTPEELT